METYSYNMAKKNIIFKYGYLFMTQGQHALLALVSLAKEGDMLSIVTLGGQYARAWVDP